MSADTAPAAMPGEIEHILLTHTGLQFATEADRARLKDRILALFAPILAEKEQAETNLDAILGDAADLRALLIEANAKRSAAEAALAAERERAVRDTLLHVRNLLHANQVPLGRDFEEVWDANAKELYQA